VSGWVDGMELLMWRFDEDEDEHVVGGDRCVDVFFEGGEKGWDLESCARGWLEKN
jgi:hypothetical protein